MARFVCLLSACALVVLAAGCTTTGFYGHSARQGIDFGPPETVVLCVYVDDGVSEGFARALVEEAWRDEALLYGLNVTVAKVQPWSRPAFRYTGIMEALVRERLEAPCDRILALVGRNVADFAWNFLPLPEVLGAVDDETLTHGYAVARRATLNQLFASPASITRHEIYHLIGCDEHFEMEHCYKQISELKQWKHAHESDFFPAFDAVRKEILRSREAVNARLLGRESQAATSLSSQ